MIYIKGPTKKFDIELKAIPLPGYDDHDDDFVCSKFKSEVIAHLIRDIGSDNKLASKDLCIKQLKWLKKVCDGKILSIQNQL